MDLPRQTTPAARRFASRSASYRAAAVHEIVVLTEAGRGPLVAHARTREPDRNAAADQVVDRPSSDARVPSSRRAGGHARRARPPPAPADDSSGHPPAPFERCNGRGRRSSRGPPLDLTVKAASVCNPPIARGVALVVGELRPARAPRRRRPRTHRSARRGRRIRRASRRCQTAPAAAPCCPCASDTGAAPWCATAPLRRPP